ncbi:MAG: hypothetical protein ACXABD_04750 [Candidatus Thorarchaeota archaeon]|jgi:hypothetical protein
MGDQYNEFSKKRLLTNLEKKFNTTTIGSLAVFEEEFGYLWGHGKHYKELTDEEKTLRRKWKKARTDILDLGGANLRASQSEIAQYSLQWNRYVTYFEIENNKDN